MTTWIFPIAAVVLILMNGFFVAAEFAIVKIRASGHNSPSPPDEGRRMRMSQHVLERLDTYLFATRFGIAVSGIGLGWIGIPVIDHLLTLAFSGILSDSAVQVVAPALSFGVILCLYIIVGERAPKSLALRHAKSTARWLSGPLVFFYRICFPVIWILNTLADRLLYAIGIQPVADETSQISDEVRLILAESNRSGGVSPDEKEMAEKVFVMAERTARQIMIPRADIAFLSTEDTMDKTLQVAHQFRYTRYPLCEGGLDHVIGMIHIKELFVIVQGGLEVSDVDSIKREVLFVPETASVKILLKEFQARHVQMAIIIDEYGGTAGLVTLEDVLEEIVGEIQDELDRPERPKFQETGHGSFIVQANALLDEVYRELRIRIDDQENDTIGGYVVTRLGRLAQPGDTVTVDYFDVRVKEVQGHRVNALEFIPRTGAELENGRDTEA